MKKLLNDRVLIEIEDGEKKTNAGIIIDKKPTPGDFIPGVIAFVGTGKIIGGSLTPLDVSVGDKVLFQYGSKITVDNKTYMLVNESDVILIL